MNNRRTSTDKLLLSLQERAKELDCCYAIQDLMCAYDQPIEQICSRLLEIIPPGFQYPDICKAKISIGSSIYSSPGFTESRWVMSEDILVQDRVVGYISVYYTVEVDAPIDGPFLPDECRLLRVIADRLGDYLSHRLDRKILEGWNTTLTRVPEHERSDWQITLDTIHRANPELYQGISRKMLNYLCWSGVSEAEQLLQSFRPAKLSFEDDDFRGDRNAPLEGHGLGFSSYLGARVFRVAERHLDCNQITKLIQMWVQEDKQSFLIQTVNTNLPVSMVADVLRRYHQMSQDPSFVPLARTRGMLIALIRRFLSEEKWYIDVAKELITLHGFHDLLQKTVYSAESRGRLGGKGAGLYLAAQVIKKKSEKCDILRDLKTPKTWYVTSDVLYHFIHHCNFDELIDQKYKPIQQVRLEYPCVSQAFKSVAFPPDIARGLSVALDDFGTNPIIVRSSSLLEDSTGSAFSGKYRSLFLANQGSKRRRLEALTDAVAEVYASTFGPDPIEYRSDRDLLDYSEEMGILIQEVVGRRAGRYFLPAFAGVAFSHNDYRWSPRIRREDGLLRMVPGLGTRAVDRLSNDYPVLFSPGQPNIRVNTTPGALYHYSPREIDVIDLHYESFQTVDIESFLVEIGYDYPQLTRVFSAYEEDHITNLRPSGIDPEREKPIATFNGLISHTPFIEQIQAILGVLEETLGFPVDIEFASDGETLYLLQCRAQSSTEQCVPRPIPKDIPDDRLLFNARRHVPNGYLPCITHVVYVDPEKYGGLPDKQQMLEVGLAVGKLNDLLPKRGFVLMGPGRWGSRGDIKLGVSVEYSRINNTAMLVEIARVKGNYAPELSYGTHFFQDLVEAQISYLPLYPDEDGIVFNESFLLNSDNSLPLLLPEHAALSDTVRVIEIPKVTDGLVMCVALNAEQNEAVAFLTAPPSESKGAGI